ncbi:DUF502 domain-containing protein [Mangrovibrevibacter kandeliae]|uniref:DUF502 domain-containing protein n=1 Tax=Mangrovibrevibacter kandeliae TaxID=2968473 RepID=UPI0021193C9D|nr:MULTISPECIES: DUF502 domain-containing protein [unclassified Aurantimonas]MCQ8782633.1 DUF502 domain-containing protein [Aurantimonas sp. CSK15Z-1]MCW4114558.1 DUF502 domain-containing protein [Aurantimonas sp. MSK8Z-1]
MGRLRNYFLTGFVICAPLAITAWITWSFIQWADSWVKPYLPTRYSPEHYLPFSVPGFGLLVALVLITLIGFLTANLIGRTVVGWGEGLLGRMPLVRTVYTALKQIFETVLADRSSSFKSAGLMEYPRKGVWCIVLIATTAKGEVAVKLSDQGEEMLAVFLPPTPNPTSGFLLFVPRAEVRILDMSIETALKLVVSSGLVTGEDKDRPMTQAEASRIVAERVRRQTEAAE